MHRNNSPSLTWVCEQQQQAGDDQTVGLLNTVQKFHIWETLSIDLDGVRVPSFLFDLNTRSTSPCSAGVQVQDFVVDFTWTQRSQVFCCLASFSPTSFDSLSCDWT